MTIVTKNFFLTHDTLQLAQDLLGKIVCREEDGNIRRYMITETEAYHGFEDKASHARFGKTKRNSLMYEEGGINYVYICYGIHWLWNIVGATKDFPSAVLVRGIDNIIGPGRVSKELNINSSFSNRELTLNNKLWLEDIKHKPEKIVTLPRVGIDYAKEYKDVLWRFKYSNFLKNF